MNFSDYFFIPAAGDRQVPHKPRPLGRVKGHNIKGNTFPGSAALWGGELHSPIRSQQREVGLSQIVLNQNDFEMLAIKVYLFFDLCYLNNYK
jgi:hypothetical protein